MNKKEESSAAGKAAAKAKVVKKKTTAKTAGKKSATKAATSKSTRSKPLISPRERYEMIATMAYYRAEQRDFEPGHDVEDWLDCERIIDSMLKN